MTLYTHIDRRMRIVSDMVENGLTSYMCCAAPEFMTHSTRGAAEQEEGRLAARRPPRRLAQGLRALRSSLRTSHIGRHHCIGFGSFFNRPCALLRPPSNHCQINVPCARGPFTEGQARRGRAPPHDPQVRSRPKKNKNDANRNETKGKDMCLCANAQNGGL